MEYSAKCLNISVRGVLNISITTGGIIIFPLIFCVENVWYTLTPCHKIYVVRDKKHIVCRRTRTYLLRSILLARGHKPCRFVRPCIIPPSGPRGRSHSQCCCVDSSGAVITTRGHSARQNTLQRGNILEPFEGRREQHRLCLGQKLDSRGYRSVSEPPE